MRAVKQAKYCSCRPSYPPAHLELETKVQEVPVAVAVVAAALPFAVLPPYYYSEGLGVAGAAARLQVGPVAYRRRRTGPAPEGVAANEAAELH